MRPKTIVSVFDSSSTASEIALARALSLADWYGSTLHVVHTGHASREPDGEDEIRRASSGASISLSTHHGLPVSTSCQRCCRVHVFSRFIKRGVLRTTGRERFVRA